jgi:hypothetical protein
VGGSSKLQPACVTEVLEILLFTATSRNIIGVLSIEMKKLGPSWNDD